MNDQFPSDRYCSMSGRSWTDLTTNAMFLSEVQHTGDLRKLFASSKSPDHYRPAFLHEATHHWCFLSPVGSTLTYLRFRACKYGLKAQKSSSALSDLLDDLVRYEVATRLMRPLAEGWHSLLNSMQHHQLHPCNQPLSHGHYSSLKRMRMS